MSRTGTVSSSPTSAAGPSAPFGAPESPRAVAEALTVLGLRPSRTLGQSFLHDPFVADAEAALVERPLDAPVVEVGGGLGILTAALLRRGYTDVTVLELDRRLAKRLTAALQGRAKVVTGDALEIPLPPAAAVVGNLPYAAATPIVIRLLKARVPRVVVMVQEEVAARLAAPPGSRTYRPPQHPRPAVRRGRALPSRSDPNRSTPVPRSGAES